MPLPHAAFGRATVLGTVLVLSVGVTEVAEPEVESSAPDPLAELGWKVTGGAAPGYVDDEACGLCHGEIDASYREVAMSKAFYRPNRDRIIETLDRPFHHEPSDRYYEMSFVEGTYRFRRYQVDEGGRPINELELDVDWILGSGNHSRTYLVQTPGGELFQLPLAWYSQTASWGMAPGYDRPLHLGVQRMVRRECMFCHNAYPDVPAGSDAYAEPHLFPRELPTGLGCQRCHGPGARHARLALSDDSDPDETLRAIVNPGKLDPRLRDDICHGCHMQPSVSLIGVRRFGRPDYSFRPGQPLAEYQVQIDAREEGEDPTERFEINHHPYRLEQSRCFTRSEGRLSCLTCHDPHRKVPVAERPAWYRARCLGCHDLGEGTAHADGNPGHCIPCHMPERRTQDVVQVTMTDHRIQRGPVGPELVAPLEERDPLLVEAAFLYPDRSPTGELGEIYRTVTVVRAGGGATAATVARLGQLLTRNPLPEVEPWLNLAMGQLRQRQLDSLETTVDAILQRAPDLARAFEWLGLARARQDRTEEAIELVRRSIAATPSRPEAHFNLGLLLLQSGRPDEALEALEQALARRPNLGMAWYYLGETHKRLERPRQAAAAYRRALEFDPTIGPAYVGLGKTLLALGERTEALRYLGHGSRVAREPQAVAEALSEAMNGLRE